MIKYYKVIYMSLDGIFFHYMKDELKSKIQNCKINKISIISNIEFIFNLSNKENIFFILDSSNPHLRLTKTEFIHSSKSSPFLQSLKKIFESSRIKDIRQYNNDRVIFLDILSIDELGYQTPYTLVCEFFGRNSNLIIINEDNIIVDSLKKTDLLDDNNKRMINARIKYQPLESGKTNPYVEFSTLDKNIYEGLSNPIFEEIVKSNNPNLIYSKADPVIIWDTKPLIVPFDLPSINKEKKFFPSLSLLMDYFDTEYQKASSFNTEQKVLEKYLKKEIIKLKNKKAKQEKDLEKAKENLKYEKLGNLLSSNLYKVKRGDSSITVEDFYNNNEEITINLDPLLSPSSNLNKFFNLYKKAQRTIVILKEQIELTENDIIYHECLEEQISISKSIEIKEIYEELNIKNNLPKLRKKAKPNITTYQVSDGSMIFVGKNNIQNNYLTHTIANKNDYFFHVRGNSGSHTILRTSNLTDNIIKLAAMISLLYSKSKASLNVPIDYTLVRFIKKVPKMKGSFVTYTNEKTVYSTVDEDFIKSNTKLV